LPVRPTKRFLLSGLPRQQRRDGRDELGGINRFDDVPPEAGGERLVAVAVEGGTG
jgi:hypothetical protein